MATTKVGQSPSSPYGPDPQGSQLITLDSATSMPALPSVSRVCQPILQPVQDMNLHPFKLTTLGPRVRCWECVRAVLARTFDITRCLHHEMARLASLENYY